MTIIQLENLEFRYPGSKDLALKPVSLGIESGEAFALLGASGAGKTTLLNLLSGILNPSSGLIKFDQKCINLVKSRDRKLAQVFQFPVLYEALSVKENLEFPIKVRKFNGRPAQRRFDQIVTQLSISNLFDKRPAELSLFQKQLVAIGKSLMRPDISVVLLDEPLTSVEPRIKWQLRETLRALQEELKLTMIYVTHDQTEALTFADRVAVMHQGEILQIDAPQSLYERPTQKFVGSFIGSPGMNFVSSEFLTSNISKIGSEKEIGFRPEWARFIAPEEGDLSGVVIKTQLTGTELGLAKGITWISTPGGEIAITGPLDHPRNKEVAIKLEQFLTFQSDKLVDNPEYV